MKAKLLVFFIFISSFVYSQSYSLSGIIMDESNQPVAAATCILRSVQDSLSMKTVISGDGGNILFSDLQGGNYILTIRHMVYETESHAVVIDNTNLELLPFVLRSLDKSLNEIVVKGERPIVKAKEGKLIYDAPLLIKDKALSNAFEALHNVPGIMGMGDNIQLVGASKFTILINGQKTSMSTEQLINLLKSTPPSRVANIEVMYSAPPQYNVRGAAINVIFNEQIIGLSALQGEGTLEYRQAFYEGYSARGNLLYAKSAFSSDLTVGVYKSRNLWSNDMFAIHKFAGHKYDISQKNRSTIENKKINVRFGLGYSLKNKDKISAVYTNDLEDSKNNPVSYTIFLKDADPYVDIRSQSDKKANDYLHNIKLEYNSHKDFLFGLDYTYYRDPSTDKYYDYLSDNTLQSSFKAETEQKINKIILFANHSVTLKEAWKINYGANFSMSKNDNKYDYYKNPDSFTIDSISDSRQKEYSASLFVGVSKSFGEKLSTQLSVSANYYKALVDKMGEKRTLWNDFEPFVNANVTYTCNPKRIVQFSFSSDINYPPYWALSGDVSKINIYSSVKGNPELKFSREYETQLLFIANQKYVSGIFYKYIPDHYIQLPYQSQEKLENMFQMVNLDYSKQYGVFFIIPFKVEKVWDTKGTLTFLRQEQKDNNFYDTPYQRSMNSFVVQMNNTFNISSKPNIKLELSGFYMYGAIQGIYDIGRMWNVNGGAKWTFMDNKAELVFKIEDVFKSGKQTTTINYMDQYSTMYIKPDAPLCKLAFTYRFGNYKKPKTESVDTSRFGR